jgi:HSP20 family protein
MARSNLTRVNPMNDMARSGMIPSMARSGLAPFEDIFRELSLAPALRALEQAPRMKVDVEETEDAYIMRADVPGATREDIMVSIDGNTVSITADVVDERSDQRRNMIRTERVYGEEFRTFTFPQDIDDARADATIDNGVLVLTLPKKTGTGGKKLDIHTKAGDSGQGQSAGGSAQGKSTSASGQGQSASSSAQGQSTSGSAQGKSS